MAPITRSATRSQQSTPTTTPQSERAAKSSKSSKASKSSTSSTAPESSPQPARPILHHLNADTSWLLLLPPPNSLSSPNPPKPISILIDPWLSGTQVDYASWFSTQSHAMHSAYSSIAEVCELARGKIDIVAISHEFTDHCHRETLEQLPKDTLLYAPKKAADVVRGWRYFEEERVRDMSAFGMQEDGHEDRGVGIDGMEWLRIERVQKENDPMYLHSAILISWPSTNTSKTTSKPKMEYLLYSPHGVHPDAVEKLSSNPHMEALCLIHGMHAVSLFGVQQLNLGGDNGLALYRKLRPKHWLGTHDEVKTASGVVTWVLRYSMNTIGAVMSRANVSDEDGVEGHVPYEALGNGASKVLAA